MNIISTVIDSSVYHLYKIVYSYKNVQNILLLIIDIVNVYNCRRIEFEEF